MYVTQFVAAQRQKVASNVAGPTEGPKILRVREFLTLNPPKLTRTDYRQYPKYSIH